jgi:hypothetical protein
VSKIKMAETMWAEMEPDTYDGPSCDQIAPRWCVYAEGDKDSDTLREPLTLDPRHFPPGTKVVISEPLCPSCGDPRSPIYPVPKTGPIYTGPCHCGFDWDKWVLEQYS